MLLTEYDEVAYKKVIEKDAEEGATLKYIKSLMKNLN